MKSSSIVTAASVGASSAPAGRTATPDGSDAPDPDTRPEAFSGAPVAVSRVTCEAFSAGFDRCFGRVYAYVSRRVNDRGICERIVSEVLAANLRLLVERGDERRELSRLKASSDRLIALESASSVSVGTIGS